MANIDQKGFSERIVTAPVSPLGQRTYVRTKYATTVTLPSTLGIDPLRIPHRVAGKTKRAARQPDLRLGVRHRPRGRTGDGDRRHARRRRSRTTTSSTRKRSSASTRTANSPARCTRSWRERIFMSSAKTDCSSSACATTRSTAPALVGELTARPEKSARRRRAVPLRVRDRRRRFQGAGHHRADEAETDSRRVRAAETRAAILSRAHLRLRRRRRGRPGVH